MPPYANQAMSPDGRRRRWETAQRMQSLIGSIQTGQADDPRLEAAQKQLGLLLAEYRGLHPQIDTRTAHDLQEIVRDFRERAKRKGIDLPKMKVVYFVRMNHVCVWPQDLEHAELQKRLHIFIVHRRRHNLPVIADDMAQGIRRAYPDYAPSRHLILPKEFELNQQETAQ